MRRIAVGIALLGLLAFWFLSAGALPRVERQSARRQTGPAARQEPQGFSPRADGPGPEAQPTATVLVDVKDHRGRPVPGVHVTAWRGKEIAQADTDARGVARLVGLSGGPVRVWVRPDMGGSYQLGQVDPAAGDRRLSCTIDLLEVVLEVALDRRPGLPERWSFEPRLRNVTEDPAGLIRGFWIANGPATFLATFKAPGYFARVLHVGLPEDVRLDLDLKSKHALNVEAAAPFDVQRFGKRWRALKRWDHVAPGRYRARDRATGAVSASVELRPEDGAATIRLDLPERAVVEGRIEVPPGHDRGACRIQLQGERIDQAGLPGIAVDSRTGAFAVPIPGDRTVRLVPVHRFLLAQEPIETVAGRSGVVLRMRAAPLARFRIPDGWPLPREDLLDIRVLVLDGNSVVHADSAFKRDGVWTFVGRPGIRRIWIDVPGSAPVDLTDVRIPWEGKDLGPLPLRAGSLVHVRYLAPADADDFVRIVSVDHLGSPGYSRGNHPTQVPWVPGQPQKDPVIVQGLGPGRFRLIAWAKMGPYKVLDEIVELDGVHDLYRTLDLR